MRHWCVLLLAAAACEGNMGEQVGYGDGSVVDLKSASSQTLRLVPGQEGAVQWIPSDRRVCNVEVRVHLKDYPKPTTTQRPPRISYALEFGHGALLTLYAPPRRAGEDFTRLGRFAVPARGAVQRVTATQLSVRVRYESAYWSNDPGATNLTWVDVGVSFIPTDAPSPNVSTTLAAEVLPGLTAWPQRFPPEATEWRLVDRDGSSFELADGTDIALYDAFGRPFIDEANHLLAYPRLQFTEWSPIAPRMLAWGWAGPPFFGYVAHPDSDSLIHALYR